MWNRKKDDDNQQFRNTPTPAPAVPVQSGEAQKPMSSMPVREPLAPLSSATIGKAVMIKGQIFSREDLVIDGEVEGSVEAAEHRVTVGPNGKVHAGVKAREIIIQGAIQGNVEATDKIDIKRDAKLIGDIKTSRIVIEDGAYFKGSIDIVKTEAKPAVRPPAPPTAASASAAPAAAPVK